MEDDAQNLLIGIGQPSFAYRNFDDTDQGALLAKWPLIGLIAVHAAMRATPLGQRHPGRRRDVRAASPRPGAEASGATGFLNAYRPAAADRAAGQAGANVRDLLDRLAGERS